MEPNPEQKQPEQQPETEKAEEPEVIVPEKEELEEEAAAEEAEETAEAKTAEQTDAAAASAESQPEQAAKDAEVVDQPTEVPEKPLLQAKQSLMYFFLPLILTILYVPAGVIWIAVRYLKYKSQGMVLTNKRLVILKGLFKKKQFMFSLDLAAKAIVTRASWAEKPVMALSASSTRKSNIPSTTSGIPRLSWKHVRRRMRIRRTQSLVTSQPSLATGKNPPQFWDGFFWNVKNRISVLRAFFHRSCSGAPVLLPESFCSWQSGDACIC